MSKLFSDIADPWQIDYDKDWQKRNDELFDRATEIQEDNPIMALALLNRFSELEQQRLKWKLGVFAYHGIFPEETKDCN